LLQLTPLPIRGAPIKTIHLDGTTENLALDSPVSVLIHGVITARVVEAKMSMRFDNGWYIYPRFRWSDRMRLLMLRVAPQKLYLFAIVFFFVVLSQNNKEENDGEQMELLLLLRATS
jgi:hypothetical protein